MTISPMKSGHFRVFGKKKYERCTHAIPLRHAKTKAKQLRATGQYLTRVDAHEGSYAVWIYGLKMSEQVKVRKKGTIKTALITSDKSAYDYASSEVKKGRGFSAKRNKSGSIIIKSWPMKKIPKPKIKVKKLKSMSKKELLRRLTKQELVVLANVSGRAKVRKSTFSNKTFEVTADCQVNAVVDEWSEDDRALSYHLMNGASVDNIDLVLHYDVNSIAAGIKYAKETVLEALGYTYYPNEAWEQILFEYDDVLEVMRATKRVNYANFYMIAEEGLYDEGWRD